MYIPGRFRTASRPSRTVMSWAAYEPLPFEAFFLSGCFAKSFLPSGGAGGAAPYARTCLHMPADTAKSPDSGTPVGRVGAVHKTALDTSRLPPRPDGSPGHKMPANRDKIALL